MYYIDVRSLVKHFCSTRPTLAGESRGTVPPKGRKGHGNPEQPARDLGRETTNYLISPLRVLTQIRRQQLSTDKNYVRGIGSVPGLSPRKCVSAVRSRPRAVSDYEDESPLPGSVRRSQSREEIVRKSLTGRCDTSSTSRWEPTTTTTRRGSLPGPLEGRPRVSTPVLLQRVGASRNGKSRQFIPMTHELSLLLCSGTAGIPESATLDEVGYSCPARLQVL